MSDLNTILNRMMNDPVFTDAVLTDADKALIEYDLSTDEIAKLREMSRADFEEFVTASPEERKSMSISLNYTKIQINSIHMDPKA